MEVIGRTAELNKLGKILGSPEPELVAVWGRRRIGKTHLIRHGRSVTDHYLEITGQQNASRSKQLAHFARMLSKAFHQGLELAIPTSWDEAFRRLEASIDALTNDHKPVTIFLDEAPWLDARRSGFIDALEHFWNTYATKKSRVKMFVCGSAASWVLRKVVKGKGGWHRRVTRKLHLSPFTVAQCREYLSYRRIRLSEVDILRLYMVVGGVPFYLRLMEQGESATTFIDRVFFSKDPDLDGEYDELFQSLFHNSTLHQKIVEALHSRKSGCTRAELVEASGIPSGGALSRYLDNLTQSDFVETHLPHRETNTKKTRYRLRDMFVLFHLRWLRRRTPVRSWQHIAASQQYKAWAGHAFELLAWNHSPSLAAAVGIKKSDFTVTRSDLQLDGKPVQIDLLFDVRGGALYLFEMKFWDSKYRLTKQEAELLAHRRNALIQAHKGRRSVIVCLLSASGVHPSTLVDDTVDLTLDDRALFLT